MEFFYSHKIENMMEKKVAVFFIDSILVTDIKRDQNGRKSWTKSPNDLIIWLFRFFDDKSIGNIFNDPR